MVESKVASTSAKDNLTPSTTTTTTKQVAYDYLKGDTSSLDHNDLLKKDLQYVIHGMYHPSLQKEAVIWLSANGCTLKDVKGDEYIDGIGGLFLNQIGHGRTEMVNAIAQQLTTLDFQVSSCGFSNVPAILLGEKIIEIAKRAFPEMRSVYYTTGGGEANEAAFHLVLRYWDEKGMKDKTKMISFNNCYHGTTYVVASANPDIPTYGQKKQCRNSSDYIQIDFPHESVFDMSQLKGNETLGQAAARKLEETIMQTGSNNIACFLFEPIQGGEGTVIPHDDFYPLARKICDKHNILMIADEVMTGFGRTGYWFAMERWNVHPDIITFAKGVSSGYMPLGGVIMTNEIYNTAINTRSSSNPWAMDYTYSGHPGCCMAGLKNIEIMEREHLVEQCARKGPIFLSKLANKVKDLPLVWQVRGSGLLFAVELKEEIAKYIESDLKLKHKIVAHAGLNQRVVDFAPSFTMTEYQWDKIVDALYDVLSSYKTRNTMEAVKDMGKEVLGAVLGVAQSL
jgi:adenosylmethionine-8-amino-7-oxononanoate aminotransferase